MSQNLKDEKLPDIQRERKNHPSRQRKEQMQKFCHAAEHGRRLEHGAQGTGVGDVRGRRGKALVVEGSVAMRKKQVFHCARDGKLSQGFRAENYGV